MRAAIYARLSDTGGGQATGVDRQLVACRDFAKARGLEVVAEFTDSDLSAFRKGVVRPGYEEMLTRLGEVDVIIVWKLDRLVRRFLEFARVWPMFDRMNTSLMSATEPIDTSNAIGRIIVLMLVGFAELESENISLRSRSKHAELRRQGKPSGGGPRPFGFTEDWSDVVPQEAAEIRGIAERLIAGESITALARVYGHDAKNLSRMMRSDRLNGRRKGQEDKTGHLPVILLDETFRAVQAVLARRRGDPRSTTRRHLLSGFVWCGRCDQRMKIHTHQAGLRYRCMSCFQSVVEAPMRELVVDGVLGVVDASDVPTNLTRDDTQLTSRLQMNEEALVELTRARFVDRIITDPEFRASREDLVRRIEDIRAQLEHRPDGVLAQAAGKAREVWASSDLSWRRSLLAAVLDRVVVQPATSVGRGSRVLDRVEPIFRA